MQQINYCPECGKLLEGKKQGCACGWHKQAVNGAAPADHRCQYQSNGRRCPLLGSICPYPYSNGPWYCSGHWRCLDDPKLGEAVLRDAEENYEKIMESRRSWRDKLFEVGSR